MPEINLPTYAQQQAILTKLNEAPKTSNTEPTGFIVSQQQEGATDMPSLVNNYASRSNFSGLPVFQQDGGSTNFNPLSPMSVMATGAGSGAQWTTNDDYIVRVEAGYTPTQCRLKVYRILEDKTLVSIFDGVVSGASPSNLKIGVFAFVDKNDYLHIFIPSYTTYNSKYYYTKLPSVVSSITLTAGEIVGTDIPVDNNIFALHDKEKNIIKLGVYTGSGYGFVQFDTETSGTKKCISIQGGNVGTNFKGMSGVEASCFIKDLGNDCWLTDHDYVLNLATMTYQKIPSVAPHTDAYSYFMYNNRMYGIKVISEVAYVVLVTFNATKKNLDLIPLTSFKTFYGNVYKGYSHRNEVYLSGITRRFVEAKYTTVVTYNITDKIKEAEGKLV